MKRVLCLWFPSWPVQWRNVARPADRTPLVVHGLVKGKPRVVACSRAARRRGVLRGMRRADAESLCPADRGLVRFEAHDPLADSQRLRELAVVCQQFSPTVGIDQAESPDCLFLDATGCDHAFGGENGFAEQVVATVRESGYWAVAATADTVGAAWAVARHGAGQRALARDARARVFVVPPGGQTEALRPLRVEALRLPDRVVEILAELNVLRVHQLLALPRNQLPSRFGSEVLGCIDRALGTLPESFIPERVVELAQARWDFESPVEDTRILVAVIDQLLERLLRPMRGENVGVKRLLWWLKSPGRDQVCFPVELLRPTQSQRDLLELVRLQVERMRVTSEVTEVTLRAIAAPLVYRQADLFGGAVGPSRREEMSGLIERLSSRLGSGAVLRPRRQADAQPERACEYDSWLALPARARPAEERGPTDLTRPTWLNDPPIPVRVLRSRAGGPPQRMGRADRSDAIAQAWGPERIETGWWRGADVRRDYYVAQTTTGERFWLFLDLASGEWYWHGTFA